jgi:Tfp pilus assembly protein PilF
MTVRRASAIVIIGWSLLLSGCARFLTSHPVDYRTAGSRSAPNPKKACRYNERGLRFLEEGKIAEAEQAFHRALIADVDFGPAHNNLGRSYFCEGKYYLAAWEFENAMKLLPDQPEPMNNLGLVYDAAGKCDDALAMFQAAHDMAPDNPEFLGNLVRVRFKAGECGPKMRESLERIVFVDPRPEWTNWAKEQLSSATFSAVFAHGVHDAIPVDLGEVVEPPSPEILPTPTPLLRLDSGRPE